MARQITIIGLGQIGASVGLALEQYKSSIKRIGHDKKPNVAKDAHAKGAVDEINFNLPSSVRDSDLVLLAVPFSELRETFDLISQDLKEGAVVMDTAPLKMPAAALAVEFIPAGRTHVGLVPSIGPDHLLAVGTGLAAARADLFKESIFLVCPSHNASEPAVKLATDLLELLGASGLFSDPLEADGMMAALHTMPQLISVALMDATVNQPGWKESRKLAGRPYALTAAAALYHDDAADIREAVLANRENVTRVLDNLIRSLSGLRDAIHDGDQEQVEARIDDGYLGGVQWLRDRLGADWLTEDVGKIEVPGLGERLQQTFLGNWVRPDKRK